MGKAKMNEKSDIVRVMEGHTAPVWGVAVTPDGTRAVSGITAEAGQIYRQYTNADHGIDGEIEFKKDNGDASSVLLYLQLKSGDSYLETRKDGTEVFVIKNQRHVEYWRDRKYPVMLVVRTSDGRIRWMDVRAYLQLKHDAGFEVKQIDFHGEPFVAAAVRAIRDKMLGKP